MKTPDEIKKGLECCFNEYNLDFACGECPYDEAGSECGDLFDDAIALIQQLEAKVPKWISVKDQMPTGQDPVLILVKETEHYGWQKEKRKVYYCQYMAYWDVDEWFTTWCNGCRKISDTAKEPYADDYEVTHWMSLPEPPEEVEHGR